MQALLLKSYHAPLFVIWSILNMPPTIIIYCRVFRKRFLSRYSPAIRYWQGLSGCSLLSLWQLFKDISISYRQDLCIKKTYSKEKSEFVVVLKL